MAVVFLFSLYLGILIGQVCCENESHSCVQTDPCLCSYNAYEKINLWPLGEVSTSTGSSNLNVSYFFHACKDVKFDPKQCGLNLTSNTCVDEASLCVCSGNDTHRNFTKIASAKDGVFTDVNVKGSTHVQKLVFKGKNVTASILLACAELESALSITGDNHLILFSPYACVVKESPGISTGTKLIIILFFAILTYFIIGTLLLRFLRGARGVEMIPNLEFWRDLPYLIRDGIIFLLSGCKPTAIVTSEVYNRI